SPRSLLRPDRALHHLHVPVAPLLDSLVQIDQPLAKGGQHGIAAVDVDEDRPERGHGFGGAGHVAGKKIGRHGMALCREKTEERVPQRWLPKPPLQTAAGLAMGWITRERLGIFRAEHEFELPELKGLKSAPRLEPRAEGEEFERRHRLEDVDLGYHDLEDGQDSLQG